MAGFCEQDDEPSGSIKAENFLTSWVTTKYLRQDLYIMKSVIYIRYKRPKYFVSGNKLSALKIPHPTPDSKGLTTLLHTCNY
jgi:hypothetical protein